MSYLKQKARNLLALIIGGTFIIGCKTTPSSSPDQITTTPTVVNSLTQPITSQVASSMTVTDQTRNPLMDLTAAAAAGNPLYTANCAMCHGDTGEGDGPIATSLKPKPNKLNEGHVAKDPDGELFLTIKNGRTKNGRQTMPPVRGLTDEQIWQVVAYIRTLAKK